MLARPDSERIFAIPEAMRNGLSVAQIHELTHIDPWFLHCISGLVETEDRLGFTGVDLVQSGFWLKPSGRGFPIARSRASLN